MFNQATLIGNLGRDPELKYTANGTAICKFSLATSKRWGEGNERTEWHRIVAWGKLAEICGQYLVKGKAVFIQGEIRYDSYEVEGVKKYTTEIHANTMKMLGKPNGGAQEEGAAGPDKEPWPGQTGGGLPEDDIPF